MNELLKKDLEKLLEAHPELKNRRVTFTNDDILFAKDAEKTIAGPEQAKAPCKIKEEFPAIIKGHSPKIEVRKSPVHGYGVFAKEDIAEGEFLEECKLLKLDWRGKYPHDLVIKDYVWGNKRCDCIECHNHGVMQYLALGLGGLYNHADTPNTEQNLNFKTELMTVKAGRAIKKDEELFVTYGDKYFLVRNFWKNLRETKALEEAAKKQLAIKGNNA